MAVPDGDDVLVLTHTNRAPADFGPLALRCGPVLLAPARLRAVGRRVSSRALGELVANDSEDEVLPKAVRNALAETDYPLAAGEVKRVLPDGTADARVEEEIVSGGKEGGRRVEVCPEGPEGLDRAKRRDLLDALLVVCDFCAGTALLAEPEYPGMAEGMHDGARVAACAGGGFVLVRGLFVGGGGG